MPASVLKADTYVAVYIHEVEINTTKKEFFLGGGDLNEQHLL